MTAKVVDVGQNYGGFTQHTTHSGFPIHIVATGQVLAAPCACVGFYVNNTTAGTLIIYDALTATNAIGGTITPALGFNSYPCVFENGIFVTVGGTIDVTFFLAK